MKIKYIASLIIIGLLTAVSSSKAQDWTTLRLATEGAFPPFNFMSTDGTAKGFDVDIGNAVCKAAKIKCVWVIQDWDGMIPALKAKKFDAIIAQMSITKDRLKQIDFSNKYANTPSAFIVPKDSDIVQTSVKDLAGKKIGTQVSTIQADFLEDVYKDSSIKLYSKQDEANLDLVNGRLDAVIADKAALDDFLKTKEGNNFKFTGKEYSDPKIFGIGAGIAIRKGNPNLKKLLNDALALIIANGTYKTINDKYFSFNIYGE